MLRTNLVLAQCLPLCRFHVAHNEIDRMRLPLVHDAHLIDQFIHEEESPSSGNLESGEFRIDIGYHWLGNWRRATVIENTYRECVSGSEDLERYQLIRMVLVTMFHCVHGGLGYSGLETFEPTRWEKMWL